MMTAGTHDGEEATDAAGRHERVVIRYSKGDRCLGNFGTDEEFQCGAFADGGGTGVSGLFTNRKYPGVCEYLSMIIDGANPPNECPYKRDV